jgi:hypothetical protein
MDRRGFLWSLVAIGAPIALGSAQRDSGARASRGPADVILIRHAEEPESGPHLSDRGRERARALPTLFPARFPRPTVLFAMRSSRQSARSVETVQPLAASLHLPIDDQYSNARVADLAKHVLTSSDCAGAHVLICWHHDSIRELATALGVSSPPPWPSSVYDRVWFLQYAGGKPTLKEESQRLLPKDGNAPSSHLLR